MLDIDSPVPLQEGESIALGLNTTRVAHFLIGLAAASPIAGVLAVVLAITGGQTIWAGAFAAAVGLAFAAIPIGRRTLSDVFLLWLRAAFRPSLWLYDRDYRTVAHRAEEKVREEEEKMREEQAT